MPQIRRMCKSYISLGWIIMQPLKIVFSSGKINNKLMKVVTLERVMVMVVMVVTVVESVWSETS